MHVLRLRSFNALEQELRLSRRWDAWVGARKPSADTIGRVFASMSAQETRQILSAVLHDAWRSKAIHPRPGEPYRVVAVDGHEIGASRARCCPQCLVREIKKATGTELEYYHRVVVAQWIGVTPPAILDLELIGPGEGEVTAARRLLERILRQHSRLIDVISADALYLEAPFLNQVLDAGKHVVIVMKQERRELFQDAEKLRASSPPRSSSTGPRPPASGTSPSSPPSRHSVGRSASSGPRSRRANARSWVANPQTSSRRRPGSGSPTSPPPPSSVDTQNRPLMDT